MQVRSLGFATDLMVLRSGSPALQPDVSVVHRREGLASHVVATAAETAIDRWSLDRLVILADPEGTAIGLYRGLGFEPTELQVQLASPPA